MYIYAFKEIYVYIIINYLVIVTQIFLNTYIEIKRPVKPLEGVKLRPKSTCIDLSDNLMYEVSHRLTIHPIYIRYDLLVITDPVIMLS